MAALNTDAVLRKEAQAIHRVDLASAGEEPIHRSLNALNSAALCLSGGGIRSAAFALGVIEALACHPRAARSAPLPAGPGAPVTQAKDSLLAKFHYLSTVSGGGYIGSWLSSWLARTHAGGATTWDAVWKALVGQRNTPDEEPGQIAWLRSYSNYLTPKLGIASADAWTDVALYLRNLILNWIVILPILCAVLLVLKLIAIGVAWFSQFDPLTCDNWFIAVAVAGCICVVIALRFGTRNRPTRGHSHADQAAFLAGDLFPAVLAGVLLTFALGSPCAEIYVRDYPLFAFDRLSLVTFGAGIGVVVYAAGWLAACSGCRLSKYFAGDLAAWIVAGAVYGILMAVGVNFSVGLNGNGIWILDPAEVTLLVFGVPWALTAQLIAEMFFVGLSSYQTSSDDDREWLGRAAGWYLATALGWLVLMFLVFAGSALFDHLFAEYKTWLTGGGAGAITAILGKSHLSPARGAAKGGKQLSVNVILAIAAPIFAAVLLIVTSAVLDRILLGESLIATSSFGAHVAQGSFPAWPGGFWVPGALVAALVVGAIASAFVNINRFSLHALYRNRIIRGFLGASTPNRHKTRNPFTGFDGGDNLHMHDLWPQQVATGPGPNITTADWRPFHVVNMALNIVSSERLAWQERKAEPFTSSPLHTGGEWVGFRDSATYGGPHGISLGTAVAISGAAASPNMGYHSSPPLAFLLTLLNVRLGWWLGNPAKDNPKISSGEGPRLAIFPLLCEMFGQTTDARNYVYLSDGGHFENLGLYEMVRRRCRHIVVSDAGCDPNFAFEDLGNAVRKIALDLGVTIRFHGLAALKKRPTDGTDLGPGVPYHAVGEIDYQAADGGDNGVILYLKAGYHGVESAGVRSYATAHPDFPHQSTADQWFTESQFESYRALGFEIADGVLTQALTHLDHPSNPSLAQIFGALQNKGPCVA